MRYRRGHLSSFERILSCNFYHASPGKTNNIFIHRFLKFLLCQTHSSMYTFNMGVIWPPSSVKLICNHKCHCKKSKTSDSKIHHFTQLYIISPYCPSCEVIWTLTKIFKAHYPCCWCQQPPSPDRKLKCADDNCATGFFQYEWLGLSVRPPDMNWLCPDCQMYM